MAVHRSYLVSDLTVVISAAVTLQLSTLTKIYLLWMQIVVHEPHSLQQQHCSEVNSELPL